MASAKLDALIEILNHHLHTDDAKPLKMNTNGIIEVDDQVVLPERPAGLPRDKIVIYSHFPSSNRQILSVRNLISE